MVLYFKKTLETIISSENEVKIAIEALREKDIALIEKVEDSPAEPTTEDLDTLSPVIEQQLDPESYESTSYSIDVGYGSSTYAGEKNYYKLANGDDGKTIGASFTAIMSENEHETLEQGQDIQNKARASDQTNHPWVDVTLDTNVKYIKEQIKLVTPALWMVMYEGKLKFN